MLVTLAEAQSYCKTESLNIVIPDIANLLYFKYDGGGAKSISITPDTYLPVTLAASIQALLRALYDTVKIDVFWNANTNKFDFKSDSASLQYINASSTAGIYIGFTQDSASDTEFSSDSSIIDDTSLLENFVSQVDKFIKTYTRRDLEATDYTGLYPFNNHVLFLEDYPINSVSVFTNFLDSALRLSVNDDWLTLKYDGTTFTFSDGNTIDKADLSTISDLVDAINALDNSVLAEITNSEFDSLSIDRILKFNPKTADGLYLKFYSYNTCEYDTFENEGYIELSQKYGNVYIEYNAGYETIPDDLKLCALQIIKFMYDRWIDNSIGQEKYRINDVYQYFEIIPEQAKITLNSYKKLLC